MALRLEARFRLRISADPAERSGTSQTEGAAPEHIHTIYNTGCRGRYIFLKSFLAAVQYTKE